MSVIILSWLLVKQTVSRVGIVSGCGAFSEPGEPGWKEFWEEKKKEGITRKKKKKEKKKDPPADDP